MPLCLCGSKLLLFAAGALFAWAWTEWGYRRGNLERQGIDLIHHAAIVHLLDVPGGVTPRSLSGLHDYPMASHRLATASLPLFDGDAVLALRFTAMTAAVWMLILQGILLNRVLPWAWAAVVVLLWQALCYWGMVSDVSCFLDGMYNYSRAVGGVGLWASLVFVGAATDSNLGRGLCLILAVVSAMFAFACHLVPGAVAFGALLLYALTGWLRERRGDRLFLLGLTLLAAAFMCFCTSTWRFMARNASNDGWLPIGPLPLLLMWVPMAAFAVYLLLHPLESRLQPAEAGTPTAAEPTEAIMAALVCAGSLQTLVWLRHIVWGAAAPYAVKSLFSYTFPLASLLAILLLVKHAPAAWQARWQSSRRIWVPRILAAVLLVLAVLRLHHVDRGLRDFVQPQDTSRAWAIHHPPAELRAPALTRTLHHPDYRGWCYCDPCQPFGAFFVNVTALNLDWHTAVFCREKLLDSDLEAILHHPGVHGILMPADSPDPLAPATPGQRRGPFREFPAPPRFD